MLLYYFFRIAVLLSFFWHHCRRSVQGCPSNSKLLACSPGLASFLSLGLCASNAYWVPARTCCLRFLMSRELRWRLLCLTILGIFVKVLYSVWPFGPPWCCRQLSHLDWTEASFACLALLRSMIGPGFVKRKRSIVNLYFGIDLRSQRLFASFIIRILC